VDGSSIDACVRIVVDSFHDDPLWSWAFPDAARRRGQHGVFWRLFVEGAVRYPFTWLTEGQSATSVWITPGGTELTEELEARVDAFLERQESRTADRVRGVFEQFERAHPHSEPHYYLSLLGTDPAQRGHGYGLGLLAENLRAIDEVSAPAYLEASNSANVPLYERYGFREWTRFQVPDGGPEIVTMWRESIAWRASIDGRRPPA
jgi:ribosomal protein S18 acetylase RimI-like enzyme